MVGWGTILRYRILPDEDGVTVLNMHGVAVMVSTTSRSLPDGIASPMLNRFWNSELDLF